MGVGTKTDSPVPSSSIASAARPKSPIFGTQLSSHQKCKVGSRSLTGSETVEKEIPEREGTEEEEEGGEEQAETVG